MKKVLLVEDEAIIAFEEASQLRSFGYEVITAGHGEEAVRLASKELGADLVLMDIDLGEGIDGAETARRILADRGIPIVFLTSHSERETVERVRNISRYGYVMKDAGAFVLQASLETAFDLFEARERALESEARQRALLRAVPDPVWVKDTEGVFIACNGSFERLVDTEEKNVIGKTDYDFVGREEAELYRENDRKAIASGKPTVFEEPLTLALAGKKSVMETVKTPLFGRDGRLLGVIGTTREITERKRFEEALRESEAKYRDLVEKALVGVYIIQDGLFRFVNERFAKIIGYSVEEIVDKISIYETIHPDDRGIAEEYIQKRLSGEVASTEYEFRSIRKDGSFVHVRVLGTYTTYRGRPAIMGTTVDITDMKLAEEALKKKVLALSQPLNEPGDLSLTDLFDLEALQRVQDDFAAATNVASLITFPDGTPITKPSNFHPLCTMIRATEAGRLNCNASDAAIGRLNEKGPIVMPCLSAGLWNAGASITLGGKHIANWLIGQVRNEEIDKAKIIDYADRIGADREEFERAFAEVPVMTTEQFNKVARALFSFANELSLKAYQNVQQARFITEREKIEKRLEKSNQEKLVLLKEMQHRMKNTLGIVASLLSLERGRTNDNRVREVFLDLTARLHTIGRLYEQLYERDELAEVNLANYLEDISLALQATYSSGPESISLVFSLEPVGLDIKRAVNLGLILNELLTNAFKYAYPEGGGGEIRLSLEIRDSAVLRISDDGRGLPPDFAERKGLGLEIVEVLVDQLAGSFTIGNTGKGTEAVLTFPIRPSEPA